jgi:hypothetical protein
LVGWPGGGWPASIIAYCMIGVPGLKVAKYNEEINLLFLLQPNNNVNSFTVFPAK